MTSNKSFSTETSERYGRAIFELAKESNEFDSIKKNMEAFLKIYNSNLDLQNFVKNPTTLVSVQLKIVNKISDLMNFPKILKNFFSVLVMKRRIFFLKKILDSFFKISVDRSGILNAKLISSKSLTDQELKNVSRELSVAIGSDIKIDYEVDNELIGGLKMQIGSLMIDTSIRNKLKKYEQIMLEK